MTTPAPNFYLEEPALARRLRPLLGEGAYRDRAEPLLLEMGELAATRVDELARVADANPPRLEGDEVVYCPEYKEMERIAYGRAGIVALAYEEPRAPHALRFALGYLFALAEPGLYCPLCMTDGAARVIERFGPPELARRYVPRLASRDPERLATGAMFLTERQGGSDVGATRTVARPVEKGEGEARRFRLFGEKWFCSNLGAEVALALARPEGEDLPGGTAGLGLFLLPRHLEDGRVNPGYRFRRLKTKLGTRSMATGEVELEGAEAYQVGDLRRGFAQMAEMLTLSRLYNAVASCAAIGRALIESRRHAATREAFGRKIGDYPLVRATIDDLAAAHEGALALTFEAVRLLDAIDAGAAGERDRKVFRILTPLAKLYTARVAVWAASEAIEMLGGNGYVEDAAVTARLLRDAQVLPIWEGTTNILTLDVLRSMAREGTHEALLDWLAERDPASSSGLADPARRGVEEYVRAGGLVREEARGFVFDLARVVQTALAGRPIRGPRPLG